MALKFGTSGVRGPVAEMTDRDCARYTVAFLDYLRRRTAADTVLLGGDFRGSTPRIMRAIAWAIRHVGLQVVYAGFVPTPALMLQGLSLGQASIMVTGSHIPDDRNGIKFNLPWGEVLKADEAEISRRCETLGAEWATAALPFDEAGMLAEADRPALGEPLAEVAETYVSRYLAFFPVDALAGMKIVLYQHSAVGRDLLARLLTGLGANVIPVGRTDHFVPVDTEAVEEPERLAAWVREHGADALVSADGDTDRPLVVDEQGRVIRGDVLGILVADYLQAASVAAPVSCNTALEACGRFAHVQRTRIGSPYVIDAMVEAVQAGHEPVVGYEANGGFLLASAIPSREGRAGLTPLPTRDAALPILAVLHAAWRCQSPLSALVATLPARYTHSGLLRETPSEAGKALVDLLTADGPAVAGELIAPTLGVIEAWDFTDGVRMTLAGGRILHLRPSGNAPEFRIYTEAASEAEAGQLNDRAEVIVGAALERYRSVGRILSVTQQRWATIEAMHRRPLAGEAMDIVIVSTTSATDEAYWQRRLEATRGQVCNREALILAVHEDWPGGAGNGLGTLYAWQLASAKAARVGIDLVERLRVGAAIALYHTAGKGTRLAPLPASEANNKPAVKLPALLVVDGSPEPMTVLEGVIRQTGVYARCRRGRLSVFWGDQVFVPSNPPDYVPRHHVDIIGQLGAMPDEATWRERQLDTYGLLAVDADGDAVQVDKIGWQQARALIDAGDLRVEGGIGPSIGSFSLSAEMALALLDEFAPELAARQGKLDSDPHFWMPMTLREATYRDMRIAKGVPAEEATAHHRRMRRFAARLLATHPARRLFGVVDVGSESFWWDYGQLALYARNLYRLVADDAQGEAARRFFRMEPRRQASSLGPNLDADEASCLVGCRIDRGTVRNSVLVNVQAERIEAHGMIAIGVRALALDGDHCLIYNVADRKALMFAHGQVMVDVKAGDTALRMVTSLDRDGSEDWDRCLPGNPCSYAELQRHVHACGAASASQPEPAPRAPAMATMKHFGKLRNTIRNYAWGSPTAISELLGKATLGQPEAEMWMGAHPSAPSMVVLDDGEMPLDQLIGADPEAALGPSVAATFGGKLPFLFKLLAAGQPLSLQAHPSKEQAEAGFAAENAAGVPLDAPHRNYKDDNHKPEIICALTEFWALRGFRPLDEIATWLRELASPAIAETADAFLAAPSRETLRALFGAIMQLPPEGQRQLLQDVLRHAAERAPGDPACAWLLRLDGHYPGDIGIAAAALLNVVRLAPGEAMYLPAGELHAYLEGVGMELMANSDNVLRGGLTPKHVDVPELLKTLTFSAGPVDILTAAPVVPGEAAYPTPSREFRLSVITVTAGKGYRSGPRSGAELLFCAAGEGMIEGGGGRAFIRRGESVAIPAVTGAYTIVGDVVCYKASVPA